MGSQPMKGTQIIKEKNMFEGDFQVSLSEHDKAQALLNNYLVWRKDVGGKTVSAIKEYTLTRDELVELVAGAIRSVPKQLDPFGR